MGGPIGRFGVQRWNLFVNGVMPRFAKRAPFSATVMQAYSAPLRDPARRTGTHVFPAEILNSREFLGRIAARLGEIDGNRLLFLWPDSDMAFREPEFRRWRALYPDARVVPLKNCGHYIFEEAGRECADALASWLK